jgi:hypothetical protein
MPITHPFVACRSNPERTAFDRAVLAFGVRDPSSDRARLIEAIVHTSHLVHDDDETPIAEGVGSVFAKLIAEFALLYAGTPLSLATYREARDTLKDLFF